MGKSALVIEDEHAVALVNRRLLELEGFRVDVALTAADGERLARANVYKLITLDMMLPDGTGLSVLEAIRERDKTTPILIVSGIGDISITVSRLSTPALMIICSSPIRPQSCEPVFAHCSAAGSSRSQQKSDAGMSCFTRQRGL
jgi:DNA-binding response OmpR family regulator